LTDADMTSTVGCHFPNNMVLFANIHAFYIMLNLS
jgi:hypothetical protein